MCICVNYPEICHIDIQLGHSVFLYCILCDVNDVKDRTVTDVSNAKDIDVTALVDTHVQFLHRPAAIENSL